jgi:hypothetical protein
VKQQGWKTAVVVVPLHDGRHASAQMLRQLEYVLSDSRSQADLSVEDNLIRRGSRAERKGGVP